MREEKSRQNKNLWVVLGIFVALSVGCVVCCGGAFGGLVTGMKSSVAYTKSLQAARQSPKVQDALGTPMEPSLMMQGSINLVNSGGSANISYSLTGSKTQADVFVRATKTGGTWTFQEVRVVPESGEPIDLTQDTNAKK